jgi:hypothetical protein
MSSTAGTTAKAQRQDRLASDGVPAGGSCSITVPCASSLATNSIADQAGGACARDRLGAGEGY